MKLDAITTLYGSMGRDRYEDLQQACQVDWTAEMGQGTYGKVYLGTKDDQQGSYREKFHVVSDSSFLFPLSGGDPNVETGLT